MAPTALERQGAHGAASSTHHLATATAMAVLARGGNAFDAVVAAGFVLQVVEPHLCGPGGEVPAVFVTAANPVPQVLCGQGVVPAGTSVGLLRDELGLDLVPGTGLLPATVPGAWDGWLTLLRDHGTWSLADVLEPAIGYAANGFPVLPQTRAVIGIVAEHFRRHWSGSAETWLAAGEVHRLPALAATWRRLLAEAAAAGADREAQIDAARDAWYRGFVAEEIDEFCRIPAADETGRAHAGLLTGDDMAAWSASYEPAVVVPAGAGAGWAVAKPAAWSQGPVLGQMVRLLPDAGYVDGTATVDTVHAAAEAAKLAFADREAWYGDSGVPVPLAELLSAEYAAERRALITGTASWELRPGSPGGRAPRLPVRATPGGTRGDGVSAMGLGEPTVARTGATRGDTVHVDVVDAAGNMVSATPSGAWLQSSPTIPALGFALGTRAQMCWLEEGLASSLVPGRRPRTTLSPSLGLRDGEPVLAFGTPGGDQQDQWQLCFWLAHTVGGLDLQAAIDSPGVAQHRVPVVVRAARLGPRRAGGGVPDRRGDAGRAAPPRPRGHGLGLVVARSDVRGGPGRAAAAGRSRPPQRLRLRRGVLRVSGAATGRGSPSPVGGCAGRTPSGDLAR